MTAAPDVFVELPPPLAETQAESAEPAQPIDPSQWDIAAPGAEPPHPPWLRLLWSQDNRGELEACGCPGSPTGGFARRKQLVREFRANFPEVLIVEGPTALSRAVLGFEVVSGEHRARARMLLELLGDTDPEAFFPGQADFAVVDPVELASIAREQQLRLVATNVEPGLAGGAYRRSLLHEVDGRRVLLLGLVGLAGTEERRQQLPLVDTVTAAREAVAAAEAEGGALDLVVALTDGDLRDVGRWRDGGLDVDFLLTAPVEGDRRGSWYFDGSAHVVRSDPLGRAFRRLDVVFRGEPGRRFSEAVRPPWQLERLATLEDQYLVGRRRLLSLESELASGKDPRREQVGADGVARVDPGTDPEAVRAELAEARATWSQALEAASTLPEGHHAVGVSTLVIRPELEEDEVARARLDEFGAGRIAELQRLQETLGRVPTDERYAGKDGCTECHAELLAHWSRTPHAEAWRALVERGEENNPDCLPCHTTGFGQPGGFADPRDRGLRNVQCEACHGPMLLHLEQAGRVGFRPDPGLRVNEASCLVCHDEANSPRFDFGTYSTGVAHPD